MISDLNFHHFCWNIRDFHFWVGKIQEVALYFAQMSDPRVELNSCLPLTGTRVGGCIITNSQRIFKHA